MTSAFHSDFGIPSSFGDSDSLFVFRQTSHARMPTAAPPKCAADETELIPALCSRVAIIWNNNQRTKTNQAGQSNPVKPDETPAHQKSESHPRKIQCVKRNDAGNAAAGADARCLRTRIKNDMRQVTDECCQCNERQITQWSQKVFHCMAKRQQEIHGPGQMNDACVKEERRDERQSTESRRLRWN